MGRYKILACRLSAVPSPLRRAAGSLLRHLGVGCSQASRPSQRLAARPVGGLEQSSSAARTRSNWADCSPCASILIRSRRFNTSGLLALDPLRLDQAGQLPAAALAAMVSHSLVNAAIHPVSSSLAAGIPVREKGRQTVARRAQSDRETDLPHRENLSQPRKPGPKLHNKYMA
jgi:hypothetical protein